MARALYDKLFNWLIQILNKSIEPSQNEINHDHLKLGLLDIFGFENFINNSFE